MKKLIYIIGLLLGGGMLWGCNPDNDSKTTWERYTEWREENQKWFAQQEKLTDKDGSPYYTRVTPPWNPGAVVLVHWFNDREETRENLVPRFTSTVDTRYIGRLYNDEPFDSTEIDAVFTTQVSGVVEGWQIALMNMHVGDTVQVVFPYQQGYGAMNNGTIPPYSALKFNMRLVDIPAYEIPAEK